MINILWIKFELQEIHEILCFWQKFQVLDYCKAWFRRAEEWEKSTNQSVYMKYLIDLNVDKKELCSLKIFI